MRRYLYNFLFFLFLFFSFSIVNGQAVDHLRAERESLLSEIVKTQKLLKTKRSSRDNTLRQLSLVSREVDIREDMLKSLESDIQNLDKSIDNNQLQINLLEEEYSILAKEYSRLLQDTYLRRNALDNFIFFMSAEDFNVAYRRYRLLKEYTNYRQNQAQILVQKQIKLESLLEDIKLQKQTKEASLAKLENELIQLSSSRDEKRRLVNSLKTEEQWLLKSLTEKENQAKDLENKILEYIRSASAGTLGNDFSSFEGKLLWPVSKGIVINSFGEHAHPVLKNVSIKNNGIDIQNTVDDLVLSVHSGEVSRVVGIPGYNTAVLIRHGKYLTVYANLREVTVSQGQKVNAGQVLGKIFKDESDNMAILHFEIWHENQKLDPVNWLIN